MRWRRNLRPEAGAPTTEPATTTLAVEVVSAEISNQLVLLDGVAIDGPAPGWPFMLPLVRPGDYSVVDAALTLMRWVARGDRVQLSTTIDGEEPRTIRLACGRWRLDLLAVGDGLELGR